MKVKKLSVFILSVILLSGSGCANKIQGNKSNLSDLIHSSEPGKAILSGVTTKSEVLDLLGYDFYLIINAKNEEVWIYSLKDIKNWARNFIPYNIFSRGFDVNREKVFIIYNESGVVEKCLFHNYSEKMHFSWF